MNKMRKLSFFITVIALIAIDQLSKFFIVANKNDLPKCIINGVLDFTYCENRGIAFGIASGHVRALSIITLIIIIAIIIVMNKNFAKIGKITAIGSAFLIAGGIGNLIDRAFRLYVVDFIDIGKLFKFPIFNIADICVVLGVIFIGAACFFDNGGESIEKNNS